MQTRTGFYTNFVALTTLLRRETWRFMRIWSQTLLPPTITMSLYFIIFGKFIGSQIQHIQGYAYIQYIVPGLIMMSIMTNAYSNTAASFFLTKFNKSIEEILVSPMANIIILLGFMLSGALRGMLVGILVTIIAFLFTHMPIYHPLIVLSMALLSAMVFSLGGLINGIYAKNFDDISFIPTFVLTPLTYLGGVFYSLSQLPPVWQKISIFNPIFEMVDSFRYGFLNIYDINVSFGFALIVGLFIVLLAWSWWLLTRGTGIKV